MIVKISAKTEKEEYCGFVEFEEKSIKDLQYFNH